VATVAARRGLIVHEGDLSDIDRGEKPVAAIAARPGALRTDVRSLRRQRCPLVPWRPSPPVRARALYNVNRALPPPTPIMRLAYRA